MTRAGDGFFRQIRPETTSDPLFILLIANAFTILLAMVEGWSFINVFIIFWFQSVTIGVFTVARILIPPPPVAPPMVPGEWRTGGGVRVRLQVGESSIPIAANVGLAVIFVAFYGFFHMGYLVFIRFFLGFTGEIIQDIPILIFSCAIFLVNHLYSFLYFRKREVWRGVTLNDVIIEPFARIVPMHLTIIVGIFVMIAASLMGFAAGPLMLLIFLLLKMLADLWAHARKHARALT